ncbi:MAG: hypothetical protein Roseis2KO_01380 [Roseivirga sp.]
MKKILLTVVLSVLMINVVDAQTYKLLNVVSKERQKSDGTKMTNEQTLQSYQESIEKSVPDGTLQVGKGISLGVSVGYNRLINDNYAAFLSPIDNTVIIEKLPRSSFVLSTALSVPLTKKQGITQYTQMDNNNNPIGPVYYVNHGWALVTSINVALFNESLTTTIFNKRIDGGIGLGYRINKDFQVAFVYEFLTIRQPKEFLRGLIGKTISVNNEVLTSLSSDNNDFFKDDYVPAFSVKFVYFLTKKLSQ